MSKHTVSVIPGDGIGPEVIAEAQKVLSAAGRVAGIHWDWRFFPIGAKRTIETGVVITDSELDEIGKTEAILFGALGDPRVSEKLLQIAGVLRLRFHYDQHVNLRPIKLYPGIDSPLKGKDPGDIDFYVVRENSEDFYISLGDHFDGNRHETELTLNRRLYKAKFEIEAEVSPPQKLGFHLGAITAAGTERAARYAFELARKKGFRRVTAVDKANVLIEMYELWRETIDKVAADYPEIELEYTLVDAITMFFVRRPEHYQVVLAPNLFGDIITDLAAALVGGLGLAPGGNINTEGTPSMFEPIHGSAPDIAGKGIANPVAAILAGKMMLEKLGEEKAALLVDRAVSGVLGERSIRTPDLGGRNSTVEVGDAIANRVLALGDAM
ncbi:MAG: isocitrate/isopropylmalate dehydrogenase family protein [Chloroflexota bacterium]